MQLRALRPGTGTWAPARSNSRSPPAARAADANARWHQHAPETKQLSTPSADTFPAPAAVGLLLALTCPCTNRWRGAIRGPLDDGPGVSPGCRRGRPVKWSLACPVTRRQLSRLLSARLPRPRTRTREHERDKLHPSRTATAGSPITGGERHSLAGQFIFDPRRLCLTLLHPTIPPP